MAENLEERLVEKLKVSKFSLQIDETTVNNSVILLAYVRYIDAMVIHEEMLFINKLPYLPVYRSTRCISRPPKIRRKFTIL